MEIPVLMADPPSSAIQMGIRHGKREPTILLFVILFGLSTDYEVFMVSQVREEWLNTGEARQSVMRGFVSTAHVVTIAATIMIAVFLAFALDPDIVVKMMCVGMVVGLFIDAIVIRMILAPATMALLGRSNWW
jgi:RND superfamily putative drug exporter